MRTFTHKELVEIAGKWISKKSAFYFMELGSYSKETPDVIGFRHHHSLLIECKCSRNDFLSDKKKLFRQNPEKGMGNYRFYLCPKDMIKPEELPEHWGLIYVNENEKTRVIINPFNDRGGNIPQYAHRFEANIEEEWAMMFTALRRLRLRKRIGEIYEVKSTSPPQQKEVA